MARLLSLAVALCAASLAVAESAAATTPCWKNVLTDSYDGRLDRTYPARCYRVALRHVPADVDAYTSASDGIRRALLAALTPSSGSAKPVRAKSSVGRNRKIAASAGTTPAEGLVAAATPAETVLSPFVVLCIGAGALTIAAAAKLVARRCRFSGPTRTAT
jgi:hypothetical protein